MEHQPLYIKLNIATQVN